MNRCLHEEMELLEIDELNDEVYARCRNCKLLFKFSTKQWKREFGEVRV